MFRYADHSALPAAIRIIRTERFDADLVSAQDSAELQAFIRIESKGAQPFERGRLSAIPVPADRFLRHVPACGEDLDRPRRLDRVEHERCEGMFIPCNANIGYRSCHSHTFG